MASGSTKYKDSRDVSIWNVLPLLFPVPVPRIKTQNRGSTGMSYRPLGNTGMDVSVVGIGGSAFGNVYNNLKSEQAGIDAIHAALNVGMNVIDTSPYYGDKQSETVIGKALQYVPRDKYYICTKVGRYSSGFDFSPERVVSSLDESLKRLNVDYVDVLHCHDIEFGSVDDIVHSTLPTLRKLKESGKVKHIGVTGLPLEILTEVAEAADIDVILSYCHYTLLDTTLDSITPYLESKGIGIFNASPLCMGLLTEDGPPTWHPASKAIRKAAVAAAELCRSRGSSISDLALQFSLSNPSIASTFVGFSSCEQVHRAKSCMITEPDLDLLNEVLELLRPVRNLTWPSGNRPLTSV